MFTIDLFFILVWNSKESFESCYPLFSHVSTLQYFQPIRHVPMVLTSKHETILVFNFHSPFIFRLRFKIIIGYWWQQNMFIFFLFICSMTVNNSPFIEIFEEKKCCKKGSVDFELVSFLKFGSQYSVM